MSTPAATASRAAQLESALRTVIRGKDEVVRLALVTIFARGSQRRLPSATGGNMPAPSP